MLIILLFRVSENFAVRPTNPLLYDALSRFVNTDIRRGLDFLIIFF